VATPSSPRLPVAGTSCIAGSDAIWALVLAAPHSETATWRSGYATACKTQRFALFINLHSEKFVKSRLNPINRLGRISECAADAIGAPHRWVNQKSPLTRDPLSRITSRVFSVDARAPAGRTLLMFQGSLALPNVEARHG
jgi:hypothetical protein